ncbi:MAG: hybrid sensor histidine kinase/response regulator, partial [Duganella sp.]
MTTTDISTPPTFDTGPLSWVMVEIREALARSRTALLEAGGRAPEDQATQLQLAKTHLHQAHGALQMVDVQGADLVTALAETALERFKSGAVKCTSDHVHTVSQLYQALVEYLEELLAGAPPQPARLYPYYRDVLMMTGAERIHPADLFFPDLTRTPDLAKSAESGEPADTAPDYVAMRQRFERALLPYLKSPGAAQQQEHAATLQDAVTSVAAAQRDGKAHAFWLAMQAFAELVASGDLAASVQVKQLFGMINLQLRRLSQGNPAQPDAMLRDALFFIAMAGPDAGSATARALGAGFGLYGLVPADIEARHYGRIDVAALEDARAQVAQAQDAWGQLADSNGEDEEAEMAFAGALADGAAACDRLDVAALGALLRQVQQATAVNDPGLDYPALVAEITTALQFAAHSLTQMR